jgi:hypothetical protein
MSVLNCSTAASGARAVGVKDGPDTIVTASNHGQTIRAVAIRAAAIHRAGIEAKGDWALT